MNAASFDDALGSGRGRLSTGLGDTLDPKARRAFVEQALAHGDLTPGLAWMAEDDAKSSGIDRAHTELATAHAAAVEALEAQRGVTRAVFARMGLRGDWLTDPDVIDRAATSMAHHARDLMRRNTGDASASCLREPARAAMYRALAKELRASAKPAAHLKTLLGKSMYGRLYADLSADETYGGELARKNIRCAVHGENFTELCHLTGPDADRDTLRAKLDELLRYSWDLGPRPYAC